MTKLKSRTQAVYDSVIRKFRSTNLPPDEYLTSLTGTSSWIKLNYYLLKRYCREEGIKLSVNPPDLPEGKPSSDRNIMSRDQIEKLILATKKSNYEVSKTFLAIATTFGTRCIELARIRPEDFDLGKKRLLIKTAKGGNPRIQVIPNEIMPYMAAFRPIQSQTVLWSIFQKSCTLAKIQSNGFGYHAIRRCLFTELIGNEVPYEMAVYFMRWKQMGQVSFTHYYKPEVDRMAKHIYPRHPFIELWK